MNVLNQCPKCDNTDIIISSPPGLTLIILGITCMTFGLGGLLFLFLPKYATCRKCGAKWKV